MIVADPGTEVSISVDTGVSGQTGALSYQVVLPGAGQVQIARTSVGVEEFPAGSGVYGVTIRAPMNPGLYMVIWDWAPDGLSITPANSKADQLVVNYEPIRIYDEDIIWPYGQPGGGADVPGDEAGDGAGNPIPSAADVRSSSNLSWADYGANLSSDTGPGGLQEIVDRAESAFYNITGHTVDTIDTKYAPQVRRVIQGMAETIAMQASSDVLDTTGDWDLISSFSAGPYSESHRSPKDMFDARMLWPVPWISQALWGLLTEDRYGFWMSFFSGVNQPAFMGTDVYWEDGQVLADLYGPAPGFFFGA